MPKPSYHHGDLKNALIQAGIEILTREGVYGLSLRKVAQRAGVSHSAPYAHFSDKQALVAAISTEGYTRLYDRIQAAAARCENDPLGELVETAWAYLSFAIADPAHFKLTFSGAVEKENDYPALVAMTRRSFEALRQVIERAQAAGILEPGPSDIAAVAVWSQVHGLACLMLESQISHNLLDRVSHRRLLLAVLQSIVRAPIDRAFLDSPNEPV